MPLALYCGLRFPLCPFILSIYQPVSAETQKATHTLHEPPPPSRRRAAWYFLLESVIDNTSNRLCPLPQKPRPHKPITPFSLFIHAILVKDNTTSVPACLSQNIRPTLRNHYSARRPGSPRTHLMCIGRSHLSRRTAFAARPG